MSKKHKEYINLRPLIDDPQSLFKVALSDRSDGKSTFLACEAIRSFKSTGKPSIFCRRYSTEFVKDFFDTFISNVLKADKKLLGDNYEIRKASQHGIKRGECGLYIDNRLAVIFIPMSMSARLKSAFDWATHHNVFYDEFIPLDNRYCYDEITLMLELYKTVDRDHHDNYMLIAGNKIRMNNPICNYWRIHRLRNGFNKVNNGRLNLFIWKSKYNATISQESPFGELVKGTSYEGYNGGGFLNTHDKFIEHSHTKELLLQVATDEELFGAFIGHNGEIVFDHITKRRKDIDTYCFEPNADSTIINIKMADEVRTLLTVYSYTNRLKFASEYIFDVLGGLHRLLI